MVRAFKIFYAVGGDQGKIHENQLVSANTYCNIAKQRHCNVKEGHIHYYSKQMCKIAIMQHNGEIR
jgi:hypothetical protein